MNYHLCKTRLNYNDTESFEYALQYYYKHFNSFSHFYKWAFFLRLHNFGNTKAMDINYPLYGLKLHKLSEFIFKKNQYSLKFNKVLTSISKFNSAFPRSKNLIHMLKLASLFECGYYEKAIMEIDSYEHFLRKNKQVHSMAKSRGLKFKDAVTAFINFKTKSNFQDKELVLRKIISGELRGHLYFWLLEKAKEINASIK
jgi:hypothetical protein